MSFWVWLISVAAASPPPPDYRAEVVGAVTQQLEAMQAAGRLEELLDAGRRFQRSVEPAAPVSYEMALAANRLGRTREAIDLYGDVLTLDPGHAAAHYDRGELRLAQGDEAAALADFQDAARLRPDHWVVHFRLADVAGRSGEFEAFEAHLTDALRQGFAFRTIVDDPTWRAWARDPRLGPVIARLIVVYDDERVLDQLRMDSPRGAP